MAINEGRRDDHSITPLSPLCPNCTFSEALFHALLDMNTNTSASEAALTADNGATLAVRPVGAPGDGVHVLLSVVAGFGVRRRLNRAEAERSGGRRRRRAAAATAVTTTTTSEPRSPLGPSSSVGLLNSSTTTVEAAADNIAYKKQRCAHGEREPDELQRELPRDVTLARPMGVAAENGPSNAAVGHAHEVRVDRSQKRGD